MYNAPRETVDIEVRLSVFVSMDRRVLDGSFLGDSQQALFRIRFGTI